MEVFGKTDSTELSKSIKYKSGCYSRISPKAIVG